MVSLAPHPICIPFPPTPQKSVSASDENAKKVDTLKVQILDESSQFPVKFFILFLVPLQET